MKKLLVKFIKLFKNDGAAKYVIQIMLFLVLIVVFVVFAAQDITGGVLEAIIGFLFSAMFLYVFKIIVNRFEDFLKINYDTEDLLQIYSEGKDYRKKLVLNGTEKEFAYATSLINDGYKLEVKDDKEKLFELDDFIMNNYDALFSAHTGSKKANGITVRLDRFEKKDDVCTFYLSRSTFFNHLVTNRAMDFSLAEGITLRDVYEFGPVISPYEKSKMSNHIGINVLVFLSDGSLLVPRRKKDSTISKNKVTSSIAVKLNFPTDGSKDIDSNHLFYQNVIDNLSARTKIRPEDLNLDRIEVEFLGFGQNLYEGGKPQFYFTALLNDIDAQKYLSLKKIEESGKLDVDKCIYVADFSSFCFDKGGVCFNAIQAGGGKKKMRCGYEMSYLCNLWHYEESKKLKARSDQ